MPNYDLGSNILVAGDSKAHSWINNDVIITVVHKVERIARNQTQEKYSGYKSSTLHSRKNLSI